MKLTSQAPKMANFAAKPIKPKLKKPYHESDEDAKDVETQLEESTERKFPGLSGVKRKNGKAINGGAAKPAVI